MSAESEDERPLRVILVDDHALFRRGVRILLAEAGVEVIGEASNGRSAVQLYRELRPDVAVIDMSMPILDGVGATEQIVTAHPDARVLMLTISSDDQLVLDALLAGASGYVLKDAAPHEIVDAVRAVAEGDSVLAPRIAAGLVTRVRELGRPPEPEPLPDLTDRELDVLRLLARGLDNAAIAAELYLSPKTVKNHVHRILEKLDVDNRVQAASFAIRRGLD